LYDLQNDIGETMHVLESHKDVSRRLHGFAEKMRVELGEALTDRKGSGTREPGRRLSCEL